MTVLSSLELPVVGAPMAGGVSSPLLVAAVSDAGGLGMLPAAKVDSVPTPPALKEYFSGQDIFDEYIAANENVAAVTEPRELVLAAAKQVLGADAAVAAVEQTAAFPTSGTVTTTLTRHPGGAAITVHADATGGFALLYQAAVTGAAVAPSAVALPVVALPACTSPACASPTAGSARVSRVRAGPDPVRAARSWRRAEATAWPKPNVGRPS